MKTACCNFRPFGLLALVVFAVAALLRAMLLPAQDQGVDTGKSVSEVRTAESAEPNTAAAYGNAPKGIKAGDWGQWGGSSIRNNTPQAKDLPTEWQVGEFDKDGKWDKDSAKNIKWVSQLGSQSYGNP